MWRTLFYAVAFITVNVATGEGRCCGIPFRGHREVLCWLAESFSPAMSESVYSQASYSGL